MHCEEHEEELATIRTRLLMQFWVPRRRKKIAYTLLSVSWYTYLLSCFIFPIYAFRSASVLMSRISLARSCFNAAFLIAPCQFVMAEEAWRMWYQRRKWFRKLSALPSDKLRGWFQHVQLPRSNGSRRWRGVRGVNWPGNYRHGAWRYII